MPLQRLTRREYVNTVRDLFGDATLNPTLDDDPRGEFGFSEAPLVSSATSQALYDDAQAIAAQVTGNSNMLLGCDPATRGEDACAADFIARFGRRAYRRTLPASETTALMALYGSARKDLQYGLKDAIRVVTAAMLQSPRFLYHWELGSDATSVKNGVVELGPFELASRLSYLLWSSMPDDQLLDAAQSGKLADDAGVAQQVTRMLASDKFKRGLQAFHTEWLDLDRVPGLSKDGKLFPEFNDGLKGAMVDETNRFVSSVFLDGDGRLATLLTSSSFANAALAKLYGLPPIKGDALQQVSLDPRQRAGLLTQGSVIAALSNPATTNPARAGFMLLSKFMCGVIAPPPPGAATSFTMDPTLTVRGNFERIEKLPSCAGCHQVINPLGYAFEEFDAIGRYRTTDNKLPVDASGHLSSAAGDRTFGNAAELAALMADTPEVQSCVTQRWLRLALRRTDGADDRGSLDGALARARSSRFDLRELLQGIAGSRSFRSRLLEPGEAQP
jgi:hypothetical protein